MAKVVTFPLALGRKDSIDPKLAPMGVLGVCRNLRVRKDGRLGARNGYQPLTMNIGGQALKAYDLHDFNGRLLALGSAYSDGYPVQALEYHGIGSGPWLSAVPGHELTPFFGLREITAIPPPSSGIDEVDTAAGGGYICVVTRSVDGVIWGTIIRESDGQMTVSQSLSTSFSSSHCRVTFSQDSFYIASQRSDNSLDILKATAASAGGFSKLVNLAFALSATAPVFDIVPVDNPTSTLSSGARFVVALDRGVTTSLTIRVYTGTGSAVGSDITLAGTDTTCISLAADQTANKIYLQNVVTGGVGNLRQYNFAGTLLVGPTAIGGGTHSTICRIPASAASSAVNAVAVVSSDSSSAATTVSVLSESAHITLTSMTVDKAVATTRVIRWTPSTATNDSQPYAVVFGAYVSPVATSTTNASNAIFFVTTSASGSNNGWAHMATRDFTRATPRTLRNIGLHLDSSTSRVCWCALRDSGSGTSQAAITTFPKHSTDRRQATTFGSLRYIAGAPLQVYDGRCLTEPFQEVPGIVSATPSNSTGTLTNSATYSYIVHWEMTLADGSFWVSAPSDPFAVTMGAADDTVTLVVSTPHHSAIAGGSTADGHLAPQITAVVSRTVFADSIQGSIYRRAVTATVPAGLNNYGDNLTIIDTTPDATLATQGAVYTQAERGALSGCLEHDAPRSGQYLAASESRLYLAGQLRRNQFQASKEAFIEEPFTFSEFSPFFGQVNAEIRGIFSLDQARLVFTADDIFAVFGTGPDDLGGGQLEAPIRIPTPSGLEDWRSFLEAPDGLYFQLDDTKLYQLPRGGGSPAWAGIDIQDTLVSYPVITGACKSRRDDSALFACQNTSAGTDGRILVRSLRTGVWSQDNAPLQTSEGIEAISAYGDTVAYISGGTVYVQSATGFADETSTVIPTVVRTQPLYPFGLGGTGLIHDVLLVGEYRSAGTLALRVSYDDGISFTSLTSFVLSGLTAGATIKRKWALPTVGAKSVIFEWTFTPTTATEGFIANAAMLLVTPDEGLPEILPAEAA